MTTVTTQITSLTVVYSIVYSGTDQRKHQSSASLVFVREFTGTGEFPAQGASNAENVSIWWRHHASAIFPLYSSRKLHRLWFSLSYLLRLLIHQINMQMTHLIYNSKSYRRGIDINPIVASWYCKTWAYTVWRREVTLLFPSKRGQRRRSAIYQTIHKSVLLDILTRHRYYTPIQWFPLQYKIKILRPKQNGRHYANISKLLFLYDKCCIWLKWIQVSLKLAPKDLLLIISKHCFR